MSVVKLVLLNEVQCKFEGLTPQVRSELIKTVTYKDWSKQFTPAVKLGRWDGKVSFMNMGGKTYIHLLDKLLPILEKKGIAVEIEDKREDPNEWDMGTITDQYLADIEFAKGHHMEGKSIILREHQVETVNTLLANRHGIIEAATGAGKTLICAALARKVQDYGRTIVIVPSTDLVTQTEEDYLLCGLDVGVLYGGRKEFDKTHTICTWQSLHALWKKSKKKARGEVEMDTQDIFEFLDGVACVIVDECHTAKGEALKQALGEVMGNIKLRWGLTGTMPKDEILAKQINLNVGPVLGKVQAKDLQDKGYLSSCDVNIIQLKSDLKFSEYSEELTYLVSDETRMKYISNLIDAMSHSGNTLVLVDRISCGNAIIDNIGLPKENFVNGSTPKKKRESAYSSIADVDNEIIVATYGVAAVGLNIPRIYNLVLIEPGKSFVRTIQSIGRGLRKAKDKDHVQIYDICSNLKYSAKHMRERKKYYVDAEYPFEHIRVADWEDNLGDE
ncbi:P-loop containing nucleoside triphosphate hydrolase [Vibrio phage 2.275.O._10N.286.54.E11]|nr:P-loop containing nucleoside triphosphate hydrolase [Vibrio phage 2.275.O._10N.286.54.E11]